MYTIEFSTTPAELSHASASISPFVSEEWSKAAWKHLPSLGTPLIVTAKFRCGEFSLFLSESLSADVATWSFAGQAVGDQYDLLLAPDSSMRLTEISEALLRIFTIDQANTRLDFKSVAPQSPIVHASRLDQFSFQTTRKNCYWISPRDFRIGRSDRRQMNRFERAFSPTLEVSTRLCDQEGGTLIKLRNEQWRKLGREKEIAALERGENYSQFVAEASHRLSLRAAARIWSLIVEGRCIAAQLHLGLSDSPFIFASWYDIDMAQWSPGRVLMIKILEYASEQGIPRMCLGRGNQAYKGELGGFDEGVVNVSKMAIRESSMA